MHYLSSLSCKRKIFQNHIEVFTYIFHNQTCQQVVRSKLFKMSEEEKQGEEKQGKKCCGFCCDFRRAVIVMAILGMIEYTVLIVITSLGISYGVALAQEAVDDDVLLASGIGVAVGSGVLAAIYVVGIFFQIFMLFGALKYNVCMLATVIFFQLVGLGYDISNSVTYYTGGQQIGAIIAQIILAAIYIYPTAGLLMEIKNGIMSPETYPREAYSCCCQPKV